jgi:CheY-specific phosphatase CheX
MRYDYIEPLVTSTIRVLDTVIQSDIAKGTVSLVRGDEIDGELAIVIKLGGDSEGYIILNMDTETALKICNVMLNDCFENLQPIGMDSISELANMIAGSAISVINDLGFNFRVYPPQILTKDSIRDETPEVEVFQIPLFTDCGEITMNISLRTN